VVARLDLALFERVRDPANDSTAMSGSSSIGSVS